MSSILSCYKVLRDDDPTFGGVGQGGGLYWQNEVGIALQQRIATLLDCELVLSHRKRGRDNRDLVAYDPPTDNFDMAYLEAFDPPHDRPDCFVWSVVSDYIGMEGVLEDFLVGAQPDLIISLQYPLAPPLRLEKLPQLGALPNLVNQCGSHGCRVVYLPWFNPHNITTCTAARGWKGMCTGRIAPSTYPFRHDSFHLLHSLGRDDVVLSGSQTDHEFWMSHKEYHEALAATRYYFSGGIYDLQIPPKYYEVCNYGACLVSPDMPMMEASGFVPWETYYPIECIDQIPMILDDDESWRKIGPAGQRMVQERHSIEQRAKDIVAIYKEMTDANTNLR